ncbi:flagellar basal body-associated FliL family protein [Marinomonas algarum]|uniref:Flagellar protein FliL n=1 Tax=Marinomonas algarum TaxID=2883105 RepID=A0A9X1ILZ7_9GAMM|nr:flagellar basal body-associated FliL family protein [Marinomonas algarum]MCB5161239.1 flagellar basal body-associated FliL family protein [Marinomonas algarum]
MSLTIPLRHTLRPLALLLFCWAVSTSGYAEDDAPIATAYVELTPDFVVNYKSDDARLRYIKAGITIRTDINQKALIEANMPLVRDALVMFLSARTSEQVTGAIAREQTRADAATAVNDALEAETGQTPVTDILFSSFVTQ